MASGSNGRLLAELRDLSTQTIPNVFAAPADEGNIHKWHALILGPAGTPYLLGMFHFDMVFPPDYPHNAPKVSVTTTSGAQVRFNPNLYAGGKVCLSILGTWRAEHSGEQWSAVQSVQSVLLSIQSLLNDAPYHNEPSFEADDGSGDPQRYNDKILHETLRVAVCEVMEETLRLGGSEAAADHCTTETLHHCVSRNGVHSLFCNVRKVLFLMNYERYMVEVRRMAAKKECKDGTKFKMMPFECPSNGMAGTFQWERLRTQLEAVWTALQAEVVGWRKQGAEQTTMQQEKHEASVSSCIHYLRQQEEQIKHTAPDGASIGPSPSNVCVWEATIFGPAESLWEGGIFSVELIFPPDFPDSPPFIRFLTSMYHPQISPSGVPYLRTLLMWHCSESKERTLSHLLDQLVRLLSTEPSPEPATHLNPEAAALCFSRSADDHKEYKRQVKRKVERSMDG